MCKEKVDPPLPTRILDVHSQNPVLILTTEMTSPYAALSHCWGLSEDNPFAAQYTTTYKTLESRINGMILDEMPRTFQDAVYVTRLLGLRYLWIDSICILQDCVLDQHREIQRMVAVYGNATVTISATSARNSMTGFLAPRQDTNWQPALVMPFKARGEEAMSNYSFYRAPDIHEPPSWLSEAETSEWNKRGWTFQECVVSRRILHFAEHNVYFECRSADTNEQGHKSR
jgi:hypothetical protein